MDGRIGSVFREARNRRKIDLSEVEAATRIRVRYLRAIENEEWDVLPGGVYTRGFIRTYAAFLGLDGERLAEDYRRSVEAPARGGARAAPDPGSAAASAPTGRWPRGGSGGGGGAVASSSPWSRSSPFPAVVATEVVLPAERPAPEPRARPHCSSPPKQAASGVLGEPRGQRRSLGLRARCAGAGAGRRPDPRRGGRRGTVPLR